MGYGINLVRGNSTEKLTCKKSDVPINGQFSITGTNEISESDLELYVSYNQSWYFYNTIDKERGIRAIYGKTGKEAIDILKPALPKLEEMIGKEERLGTILSQTWGKGNAYDPNDTGAWGISAKVAKSVVEKLITLAGLAPTFTFEGD